MNILIIGASGFIGRHLLHRLQQSRHTITVCIHKTDIKEDVKVLRCDFSQMLKITDWLPLVMNIDVVINCVGIIAETKKNNFQNVHYLAPKALFQACEKTRVKRIIHLSALGADKAQVAYHKSKKQADDVLKNCSVEWFILRPSLIVGKGGKSFAFFKRLSQLPIVPLIGSGQQRIQPVDVDVLLDVIEKCLASKHSNRIINVVSKNPITYQQWMLQLRTQKYKPLFLPVPLACIKLMLMLLKPFRFRLFSSDNITMLEQSIIADFAPLQQFMKNSSITGE